MNIPVLNKTKIAIGLLMFVILGLVLLLVRENEGRVAAETKLNDLKYKLESSTNEKDSLISDLKNNIHDLEVKIADLTSKYDAQLAEKTSQIQSLQNDLEAAAKKYDGFASDKSAEIAQLETKSKVESGGLNKIIKEKSSKIGELGDELQKASARYSTLLKEKESIEARAISCEADIASLRSDLKKVEREKERLSDTVKSLTQKPQPAHD